MATVGTKVLVGVHWPHMQVGANHTIPYKGVEQFWQAHWPPDQCFAKKGRFNRKGLELAIGCAHSITDIISGSTNAWESK